MVEPAILLLSTTLGFWLDLHVVQGCPSFLINRHVSDTEKEKPS